MPSVRGTIEQLGCYAKHRRDKFKTVSEYREEKLKEPKDDPFKSPVREPHDLFLYDTITNEKMEFQFVPKSLNYEAESNFVSIASIGRNNPFYHYTGSEDSLEFELDYFSAMDNRHDVIKRCRWVEALTKADGEIGSPHP